MAPVLLSLLPFVLFDVGIDDTAHVLFFFAHFLEERWIFHILLGDFFFVDGLGALFRRVDHRHACGFRLLLFGLDNAFISPFGHGSLFVRRFGLVRFLGFLEFALFGYLVAGRPFGFRARTPLLVERFRLKRE